LSYTRTVKTTRLQDFRLFLFLC